MGSGFNFFTNGIDVTPSTTGSWVDVDVSAYIPEGSTGVILKIMNTGTATYNVGVRKNGSSDNFGLYIPNTYARHAFVGVDSNRIFEAYIGSTSVKIYLVGYCDSAVDFFTNAVDKTPSIAGDWVDVDASGNIPEGSTGVICLLYNADTATNYYGGIRKNGSSDTFTYGQIRYSKRFVYQLCGVDSNRIFEANIQNTNFKIMLIGYTKQPITFFTNGIDKSITSTNAWTDIDITSETESTADGAILFLVNTSTTAAYKGDVRKNGSTDNHTANTNLYQGECRSAAVGLDSEQIFEGYISNTAVKFYLIGYCKPAAVGQTIAWSAPLKTNHAFSRPFRSLKLMQTLNLAHAFIRHRFMQFTQALKVLRTWTLPAPLFLKQWFAAIQTTHVFRRPERKMLYAQALKPIYAFRRPLRVIKIPVLLNLTHSSKRIHRLMRLLQQSRLVHTFYVSKPGVRKTRLFLVIGELAFQLSGD